VLGDQAAQVEVVRLPDPATDQTELAVAVVSLALEPMEAAVQAAMVAAAQALRLAHNLLWVMAAAEPVQTMEARGIQALLAVMAGATTLAPKAQLLIVAAAAAVVKAATEAALAVLGL
jgi:hypothetical protein